MTASRWQQCLNRLQMGCPRQNSLHVDPAAGGVGDNTLTLYAANRFFWTGYATNYLLRVNGIINELCGTDAPTLRFDIGNRPHHPVAVARAPGPWCRSCE